MKKIASLILILTPLFALGQNTAKSTLRFDKETHDFGRIEETAGKVTAEFEFTNTGSTAVVIERIEVSCGCTTPEYSKAPVLPGKKGKIKITYDPANRPGYFMKDVYIRSGEGKNLNVIKVKGEVNPRPKSVEDEYPYPMADGIRLSDLSMNFRYVEHGQPRSMVLGVVNTSNKNVRLTFNTSQPVDYLVVSGKENLAPGEKTSVTVTFDPKNGSNVYGKVTHRLYPVINGTRAGLAVVLSAVLTDNFTGKDPAVAPRSTVTPNYYNFGEVKKGKKLIHSVVISNEGKEPLIIRKTEYRSEAVFDLRPGTVIQPGASVTARLTIDTEGIKPGVSVSTVTLITNDPLRPMREIRFSYKVL